MVITLRPRAILLAALCCTFSLLWPCAVRAVPMVNDPQGFGGIAWGSAFKESEYYLLVESSSRIKGYELKQGPPPLGAAKMDAMRFLTIDGKFGRVIARYHGLQTHAQVLAYLEAKYGPQDRTPGQFSEGVTQHLNWRGPETEINLTYDFKRETGLIFFESQSLMLEFQNP